MVAFMQTDSQINMQGAHKYARSPGPRTYEQIVNKLKQVLQFRNEYGILLTEDKERN